MTLSAAVVRGSTTNAVKVIGPRGGRSRGRLAPAPKKKPANEVRTSSATVRPRSRRGGELRGKPYTQVTLSVYVEQLRVIDAAAARAQMPRSEFMRKAALHFAAFVTSDAATCTIASGGCSSSGVPRG